MKKLDLLFANFNNIKTEVISFTVSQPESDSKPLNYLNLENPKVSVSSIIDNRFVISELKSEVFCNEIDGKDVLIDNIVKSKINLHGKINSLRIRNIIESTIEIVGVCNGTIYIENVNGGSLTIAGDQVRIHDCVNVDIYLFAKSSCILENCSALRFHRNKIAAALNFETKDNDENNDNNDDTYWTCIQDFGFNPEGSYTLLDEPS